MDSEPQVTPRGRRKNNARNADMPTVLIRNARARTPATATEVAMPTYSSSSSSSSYSTVTATSNDTVTTQTSSSAPPERKRKKDSGEEFLPPGWRIEIVTRTDGKKDDKYWFSPDGQKFRSKIAVLRHLNPDKFASNDTKVEFAQPPPVGFGFPQMSMFWPFPPPNPVISYSGAVGHIEFDSPAAMTQQLGVEYCPHCTWPHVHAANATSTSCVHCGIAFTINPKAHLYSPPWLPSARDILNSSFRAPSTIPGITPIPVLSVPTTVPTEQIGTQNSVTTVPTPTLTSIPTSAAALLTPKQEAPLHTTEEKTPSNEEKPRSSEENDDEAESFNVIAVTDCRFNKSKKRWEWRTEWAGNTFTWEPRECFVEVVDGVEIHTQQWFEFEEKRKANGGDDLMDVEQKNTKKRKRNNSDSMTVKRRRKSDEVLDILPVIKLPSNSHQEISPQHSNNGHSTLPNFVSWLSGEDFEKLRHSWGNQENTTTIIDFDLPPEPSTATDQVMSDHERITTSAEANSQRNPQVEEKIDIYWSEFAAWVTAHVIAIDPVTGHYWVIYEGKEGVFASILTGENAESWRFAKTRRTIKNKRVHFLEENAPSRDHLPRRRRGVSEHPSAKSARTVITNTEHVILTESQQQTPLVTHQPQQNEPQMAPQDGSQNGSTNTSQQHGEAQQQNESVMSQNEPQISPQDGSQNGSTNTSQQQLGEVQQNEPQISQLGEVQNFQVESSDSDNFHNEFPPVHELLQDTITYSQLQQNQAGESEPVSKDETTLPDASEFQSESRSLETWDPPEPLQT